MSALLLNEDQRARKVDSYKGKIKRRREKISIGRSVFKEKGYHLLNMNVDRLEFGYCRETNDDQFYALEIKE